MTFKLFTLDPTPANFILWVVLAAVLLVGLVAVLEAVGNAIRRRRYVREWERTQEILTPSRPSMDDIQQYQDNLREWGRL